MREIRKSLSEIQFKSLLNAQIAFNQTLEAAQDAERRLAEIRTLVFDALGVTPTENIAIDANTRELVINEPI